ncbi:uncharacterized protein NEMAJ01_1651 [Nematocida major]|uniref:uncharacterized protein n=1 Tax=Nematocida major TaxID=1912982 RepID=UPI00200739F5|nr:uncharacterized protein NEMAJ01_1651 [Nematocida major]KAH9386755.1 hypothetical protein NEMAJ01_1651 [Nematocida major]
MGIKKIAAGVLLLGASGIFQANAIDKIEKMFMKACKELQQDMHDVINTEASKLISRAEADTDSKSDMLKAVVTCMPEPAHLLSRIMEKFSDRAACDSTEDEIKCRNSVQATFNHVIFLERMLNNEKSIMLETLNPSSAKKLRALYKSPAKKLKRRQKKLKLIGASLKRSKKMESECFKCVSRLKEAQDTVFNNYSNLTNMLHASKNVRLIANFYYKEICALDVYELIYSFTTSIRNDLSFFSDYLEETLKNSDYTQADPEEQALFLLGALYSIVNGIESAFMEINDCISIELLLQGFNKAQSKDCTFLHKAVQIVLKNKAIRLASERTKITSA